MHSSSCYLHAVSPVFFSRKRLRRQQGGLLLATSKRILTKRRGAGALIDRPDTPFSSTTMSQRATDMHISVDFDISEKRKSRERQEPSAASPASPALRDNAATQGSNDCPTTKLKELARQKEPLNSEDFEEARRLFKQARASGGDSVEDAYTSILSVLQKAPRLPLSLEKPPELLGQALCLFKEMKEKGIVPSRAACRALIGVIADAPGEVESELLVDLLNEAKKRRPDPADYTLMLRACARAKEGIARSEVWSILAEMKKRKKKPRAETYRWAAAAIQKTEMKDRWLSLVKILRDMKKEGIQPDHKTLCVVLSELGEKNCGARWRNALEVLYAYSGGGEERNFVQMLDEKEANRPVLLENAAEVFDKITEKGVVVDPVKFCVVVVMLAVVPKGNAWRYARIFLHVMEARGFVPRSWFFSTLIQTLSVGRVQNTAEGGEGFSRNAQNTENWVLLTLKRRVRLGDWEVALRVYRELHDLWVHPSRNVWDTLMGVLVREGRWVEAVNVWSEMKERGDVPFKIYFWTFQSLVEALDGGGEREAAEGLVRDHLSEFEEKISFLRGEGDTESVSLQKSLRKVKERFGLGGPTGGQGACSSSSSSSVPPLTDSGGLNGFSRAAEKEGEGGVELLHEQRQRERATASERKQEKMEKRKAVSERGQENRKRNEMDAKKFLAIQRLQSLSKQRGGCSLAEVNEVRVGAEMQGGEWEKTDRDFVTAVVSALANIKGGSQWREAWDLVKDLDSPPEWEWGWGQEKGQHEQPSVKTYTALLSCFARSEGGSRWIEAQRVFDQMRNRFGDLLDVRAYTEMLNVFEKSGEGSSQWEAAVGIFDQMRHAGIQPSVVSYTALIGALAEVPGGTNLSLALRLFDEAKSAEGGTADVFLYNKMLRACERAKRGVTPAEVWGLLEDMDKNGVRPTVETYRWAISAMRKAKGGSRPEQALRLLERMKRDDLVPDEPIYCTVISALAKWRGGADWRRALEVLDSMSENGIVPGRVTLNSGLHAMGKAKKGAEVGAALEILQRMKETGIAPDEYTYVALLSLLEKQRPYSDWKAALEVFRRFREKPLLSIRSQQLAYASVLRSLAKAEGGSRWKEALAVHGELQKERVEMNEQVMDSFLLALCNSVNCSSHQDEGLSKRGRTGMEMDEGERGGDRQCVRQVGQWQLAFKVFEEMKLRGVRPKKATYTHLINACAGCALGEAENSRSALWEKALELFEDGRRKARATDVLLCKNLMGVLVREGRWEEAVDIWKEIKEKRNDPFRLQFSAFQYLVEELDRKGGRDVAKRLLRDQVREFEEKIGLLRREGSSECPRLQGSLSRLEERFGLSRERTDSAPLFPSDAPRANGPESDNV
uniref:Pentacotripeptide-repeat region of PRORP domain-containing protein n=1 Tax=Chromera velia CCMP2878 TaxID=1169474 RepID=A0A0G4GGE9_9ALVE|eukprot:Cvel_21780.t1-p1 / transcript=Cvel_21780.t1 / gene=Cvel_21780 / organism=Chromera_velia_CCMP2878 / gene_product=Pentatricopeptide repeat-containing protein, putative / transcript_product=Pentatricopeptide repeat-containing protein, putative / location=Cvel_scaffold2073:6236-12109(+) / protein_length=1350 / sequence_SO=supercontig / SO=protein_coding / is_pseudo=false